MDFGDAPNELLKRVDFEKNLVEDHVIDINQQLDVILESPSRGNFQSEKDASGDEKGWTEADMERML